jgi:hypothetical protein
LRCTILRVFTESDNHIIWKYIQTFMTLNTSTIKKVDNVLILIVEQRCLDKLAHLCWENSFDITIHKDLPSINEPKRYPYGYDSILGCFLKPIQNTDSIRYRDLLSKMIGALFIRLVEISGEGCFEAIDNISKNEPTIVYTKNERIIEMQKERIFGWDIVEYVRKGGF